MFLLQLTELGSIESIVLANSCISSKFVGVIIVSFTRVVGRVLVPIQHVVGLVELQSVLVLVVVTKRLVLLDREPFGLV